MDDNKLSLFIKKKMHTSYYNYDCYLARLRNLILEYYFKTKITSFDVFI